MSRRGNGQVWDPAPTPGVGMDGGETETEGVEVPDSRLSPLPPPPPAPPLDGKDLSASPDHMNSSPGSSPSTYTANEPSAPGQASPRVVVTPDVGAQAGVGAKGDVHPTSPRSQRVQSSPSSRRGGGSTNIDRASFLSLSLSTSVSEEPTENSGRDDASSGSVQTRSFDDLPQIDELILEYLLFRGFTQSFHVSLCLISLLAHAVTNNNYATHTDIYGGAQVGPFARFQRHAHCRSVICVCGRVQYARPALFVVVLERPFLLSPRTRLSHRGRRVRNRFETLLHCARHQNQPARQSCSIFQRVWQGIGWETMGRVVRSPIHAFQRNLIPGKLSIQHVFQT